MTFSCLQTSRIKRLFSPNDFWFPNILSEEKSGTEMMWEGVASTPTSLSFLPSSDLRILTLAKNPANTVGGNLS